MFENMIWGNEIFLFMPFHSLNGSLCFLHLIHLGRLTLQIFFGHFSLRKVWTMEDCLRFARPNGKALAEMVCNFSGTHADVPSSCFSLKLFYLRVSYRKKREQVKLQLPTMLPLVHVKKGWYLTRRLRYSNK